MSISTATDDAYTTLLQNLCQETGVCFDICTVGLELISQRFSQADSFTSNGGQVRAALHAREYSWLQLLEQIFAVGHH
ncbi:hypothetical protein D3C73_1398060 [compost metagenome]